MYYKPLENLNQPDLVKINSIGKGTSGKYGIAYPAEVTVNEENMIFTLSEDKLRQLKEAGFGEGDTVRIEKWREGVKTGYNFVKPTSSNPPVQPFIPKSTVERVDNEARGKTRCALVCAYLSSGKEPDYELCDKHLKYIFNETI